MIYGILALLLIIAMIVIIVLGVQLHNQEKLEAQNIGGKIPDTVDYYVYESAMARAERHSTRWRIAFFVIFASLLVTNIAWIVYENQFEDAVTTTVTQDLDAGEGDAIINDGVHINGESTTNRNGN